MVETIWVIYGETLLPTFLSALPLSSWGLRSIEIAELGHLSKLSLQIPGVYWGPHFYLPLTMPYHDLVQPQGLQVFRLTAPLWALLGPPGNLSITPSATLWLGGGGWETTCLDLPSTCFWMPQGRGSPGFSHLSWSLHRNRAQDVPAFRFLNSSTGSHAALCV